MIEVLSMKMSKFYEVSKLLGRRTDTDGRFQYLVRWAGYGKATTAGSMKKSECDIDVKLIWIPFSWDTLLY